MDCVDKIQEIARKEPPFGSILLSAEPYEFRAHPSGELEKIRCIAQPQPGCYIGVRTHGNNQNINSSFNGKVDQNSGRRK